MCEICHCSDHDSTSCPYYISDDGFIRLSSIIEAMNKQQVEFINKIQENDLSPETDLTFSSPRLDAYLCNDGVSHPLLESRLEEEFSPPLITASLVVSSSPSSPRHNTTFNMTLSNPPLPFNSINRVQGR